jgi:NAD(P)H-flavin reductase
MIAAPSRPLPQSDPWMPLSAHIRSITPEIAGTTSYEFELADAGHAAAYRFQPGQFNMLYLPGFGESAISISSDPERPELLGHTVRVAGIVTGALARCGIGDEVLLRGPFGSAWPIVECIGRDVVVAAGGIGLAPLRPLIYHVVKNRSDFRDVHLLYGARSPEGLLYRREFDVWRKAGINVDITVDVGNPDWLGHIGVVPTLLHRLRVDAANCRVLTCGPEIMMRYVIFEALASGIAAEHAYLSMERNMNCAVGFCGHCQLGPTFICKDGPVFSYPQMEPYMHIEDL